MHLYIRVIFSRFLCELVLSSTYIAPSCDTGNFAYVAKRVNQRQVGTQDSQTSFLRSFCLRALSSWTDRVLMPSNGRRDEEWMLEGEVGDGRWCDGEMVGELQAIEEWKMGDAKFYP